VPARASCAWITIAGVPDALHAACVISSAWRSTCAHHRASARDAVGAWRVHGMIERV